MKDEAGDPIILLEPHKIVKNTLIIPPRKQPLHPRGPLAMPTEIPARDAISQIVENSFCFEYSSDYHLNQQTFRETSASFASRAEVSTKDEQLEYAMIICSV